MNLFRRAIKGSPVFIGGRGLKHKFRQARRPLAGGSPVFIGGRGLKPGAVRNTRPTIWVRPSLLAGAD